LRPGLKSTNDVLRIAGLEPRAFNRISWAVLGAVVAGLCLFPSCNDIINYPAPIIAELNPSTIEAGSTQSTLIVTGYKLTPASSVLWDGSPLVTYFQSINELTAVVPQLDIASPGSAEISIETPQPGGGTSTSLILTISPPATPVPAITSLSPNGVVAGGAGFQLVISGTNFVNASVVTVNGDNRSTTFVSSQTLETQIQSGDVATAGYVPIAVVNPVGTPPAGSSGTGGGGASIPVSLLVKNPVPTITSLSPTAVAAGTTATIPITITGANFVPNSTIEIDGSSVGYPTTFGGGTQVSVSFEPGDLISAAVHTVQVVNPGPGGGISNILILPVNPTIQYGLPELLDYGYNGSEANQGLCGTNCATGPPTLTTAGPSITSNGNMVAFASTSTNLLYEQANTGSDVFARTTCLGNSSCTPTTTDVSVGPNNAVSNGNSWGPSIDSTGDHVAFTSTASNLVPGVSLSPGSEQVYWMPVCATPTSSSSSACSTGQLVSIAPDDITPGNGNSYDAAISPDGRYVVFVSLATNLVSSVGTLDGKTPQVFLRDTCNGATSTTSVCAPTTYLISTPDGVTPGDGASSQPSVANDGDYVSYSSSATNLGATAPNPNGQQEIFEQTTCLPTVTTPTVTSCAAFTTLISTPDGVTPANGSSSESQIASAGRFIVFASTATNLATGAGPVQQVYMYDTCLNASSCVPSLSLISTPDGSTAGNGPSEYPSVSLGSSTVTISTTAGEYVAFDSQASNLAGNTANGVSNVFVRKACVGFSSTVSNCTATTVLVSQAAGTSPPPANGDSLIPVITGDGHTVVFISAANNLVANDTNGFYNLFLGLSSF
jgi:WD40-like Beta Propeller Repeat